MDKRAMGIAATAGMVVALSTLGLVHTGQNSRAGAVNPMRSLGTQSKPNLVATARSAQAARDALRSNGPLRISVLCDSVGNDRGEWVEFWAKELAADRDVTVRYYSVVAPGGVYRSSQWNPAPLHLPARTASGKGPVTVWTFGWAGGTPELARRHQADVFPENPDLIVYSYGLNLAADNVRPQFEGLHSQVRERFPDKPVVGILPHMTHSDRAGQALGRKYLAEWMLSRGIPVVDERQTLDPWRNGRTGRVFMDPVHPNWVGHMELTRVVSSAVRGAGGLVEAPRRGTAQITSRSTAGGLLRVTVVLRDDQGRAVPYAVGQAVGVKGVEPVESSVDGAVTVDIPQGATGVSVSDGITTAVAPITAS